MMFPTIDLDDIPSSISEFFTPEQFTAMSDYEKKSLSNLRHNYETFCRAGFPVQPPDFMLRNKSKRDKDKLLNHSYFDSSDGSDSEWTPDLEKAKKLRLNQKKVFKPPKKMCSEDTTMEKLKLSKSSKRRKQGLQREKAEEKNSKEEEEVHLYPFRKKRMTSYMCVAFPDDDDYLYCEECNQEYYGDCPLHGPLLHVCDSEIPPTCTNNSDEFCRKTIPEDLVIKKSRIPKAGLGVFAVKDFPARTKFGPYRGKIEMNEEIAHESGYSWLVMKDGQTSHFVDARDTNESNWMRFVNCARHEDEQCVTAYQYQGEIYYRSHKHILSGTELLVYYGDSYAKELGVQVQKCSKSNRSFQRWYNMEEHGKNTESDKTYSCSKCQVSFSKFCYLKIHLQYKHNDTYRQLHQHEMLAEKLTEDQRRVKTQIKHIQMDNSIKSANTEQENSDLILNEVKEVLNSECLKSSVDSNVHESINRLTLANKNCSKEQAQAFKSVKQYIKLDEINNVNCVDIKCSLTRSIREKPYRCDVCSFCFTLSGDLKQHKRIHTGEKPYKCDVCSACFTQSGHLKQHKRIHTGEKPYKCDVCSACFTLSGHLKQHKRIHTGEKPYKCDVCSACFTLSGHLKQHKRIHTGEKPYKCDVCSACFTQSGHLKQHKRIHTGEKPYKCDVCSACFTLSGDLKKHKRIHTGEKPYKCDVCSVCFTHSGTLKQHKRIHTGEKPYKCDVCSACFTLSGHLKKHKRIHTGEKPYKCDVCSACFTHSGHLNWHMKKHT